MVPQDDRGLPPDREPRSDRERGAGPKTDRYLPERSERKLLKRNSADSWISWVVGPFYNHFASKEALMAETLTHEMQRATADLDSWSPTEGGKAQYADAYLSEEHMENSSVGCAVAALASEVRQV